MTNPKYKKKKSSIDEIVGVKEQSLGELDIQPNNH